MYATLCRLIHGLHAWPRTILALSGILTIISLFIIPSLEWRLSLLDLFPENLPTRQVATKIQEKFGGFGTLDVLVHSKDPVRNRRFVEELSKNLASSPLVNFSEYRTEAEFYRRNKLLYIQLDDLESIRDRILNGILKEKIKANPFIVDLGGNENPSIGGKEGPRHLVLDDLEKKYLSSLKEYLGTADQRILLLRIFPSFDVDNLEKAAALQKLVNRSLPKTKEGLEVRFAGEIFETLQQEGSILSELLRSAWISLTLILLLLLIFFYRQPMVPLLTLLPLAMGMCWTLAFARIAFGHLNLMTIILALVLLGLGIDAMIHLLARYGEERRKGLGPEIAFENIILETGPPVTASALTSAAAFYCLAFLDFSGFRQFGILAGTGMLLNWVAVMLTFPALLLVLQKGHMFPVLGRRIVNHEQFLPQPFLGWKNWLPLPLALSLLLLWNGALPDFQYDFSKLGLGLKDSVAQNWLERTGEGTGDPAVILTPDAATSAQVAQVLRKRLDEDPTPTFRRIVTFTGLLPDDQDEKIEIIEEIQELLTPDVISRLRGENLQNVKKLQEVWDIEALQTEDLPESYRRKFMGRDGSLGEFSFVFPNLSTSDGRECQKFSRDLQNIRLEDGRTFFATGRALLRADLLNLVLPQFPKAAIIALLAVFILLLLHLNNFVHSLLIFVPTLVGMFWLTGSMRHLGLEVNPFNILLFPVLIGLSMDTGIHLFHRYREEGKGSLIFVLRRTGLSVSMATLTTAAGFGGLLFSSHAGLQSMGVLAILGFICNLAAHFAVFPTMVGFIDARRYRKELVKKTN